MGNVTVSGLVTAATAELIAKANEVVSNCTGPNCNTSPGTQAQVRVQLAELSASQAQSAANVLGVDLSSATGRAIYDSYTKLGNTVAATYNYQCGDNVSTSFTCVSNAQSVHDAQNQLEALLVSPAGAAAGRTVIISTIAVVAVLAIFAYLIFFIIGLVASATEAQPVIVLK